jgi:hypothetical protein
MAGRVCTEWTIDNGFKCISFMQLVPGWVQIWNSLAVLNAVFDFGLALSFINLMAKIINEYRQDRKRRHPLLNLMFWSCMSSVVGYTLMGVSYIDGWGFLGRFKRSEYLGMYSPATGLIAFSVICLQAHYLDVYILTRMGSMRPIKATVCVLSMVYAILGGLYSGPGYIIFGWKLRSAYIADPKTKLGFIGNILVIASYAVNAIGVLCVALVIYEVYKYSLGKKAEDVYRMCSRLVNWAIIIFVLSCMYIGIEAEWTFDKLEIDPIVVEAGLAADVYVEILNVIQTIILLLFSRIIEWGIGFANKYIIEADSLDVWPIENIVRLFTGNYIKVNTHTSPSVTQVRLSRVPTDPSIGTNRSYSTEESESHSHKTESKHRHDFSVSASPKSPRRGSMQKQATSDSIAV